MKQIKLNLLAIVGMMVAVGTVAFTAPTKTMIDAQDQIWVYLDNTAANHDNPSRYTPGDESDRCEGSSIVRCTIMAPDNGSNQPDLSNFTLLSNKP